MNDYQRQLMDSARKGSTEAFEKLAEAYYKKVYNIILKNCGAEADVSELAQEVFVRVFKNLKHQPDDSMLAISIYKSTGDVCTEAQGGMRLIS
jgi:RNA polymerase sigma-70 factor (ECF subfamily)